MEQQDSRLVALHSLPPEKILTIGMTRYLSASTVAGILGKTSQSVSAWCRNRDIFRGVRRMPQPYKAPYLIPFDEVERAITEDRLPRPGNPAFRSGRAYPYSLPKRERGKHAKREKQVEPEPADAIELSTG